MSIVPNIIPFNKANRRLLGGQKLWVFDALKKWRQITITTEETNCRNEMNIQSAKAIIDSLYVMASENDDEHYYFTKAVNNGER